MVNLKSLPTVRLNTGMEMPILGLGTYNMVGRRAEQAVFQALQMGYRLLDTAAMYGNEVEIGKAVRETGIPRAEIFITSKVNNPDQGYGSTLKAFEISLGKLKTDYLDLYLIHWPVREKRRETWKALERIFEEGRARAIGVANYLIPFLEELELYGHFPPAVNQVEFSPFLFLEDLLQYCLKKQIRIQAYCPLVRGEKEKDPGLMQLAHKYNKTPAQILLRWNIELGVVPIPKSSNPVHLAENLNVFDFELKPQDMALLSRINEGLRLVDDPMRFF
jgi:methylglyoxal/glyoxal reductase